MTRRLLPLLLALLLCTACGGNSKPSQPPSPTASPTSPFDPQRLEAQIAAQLEGSDNAERLTNTRQLLRLAAQLREELTLDTLDGTTVTGRVGDVDELGWNDCDSYNFAFATPRVDSVGEHFSRLSIIYWPEADVYARVVNDNYATAFCDNYDAMSASPAGDLLAYFCYAGAGMVEPAERYDFYNAVRLLSAHLNAHRTPAALAALYIQTPPGGISLANANTDPWIFEIEDTAFYSRQVLSVDTQTAQISVVSGAQLLTAPLLPIVNGHSQGTLVKVNTAPLRTDNYGTPLFYAGADCFIALNGTALYRLDATTGALSCLQQQLTQLPALSDDGYLDDYQYQPTHDGLMLYTANGARVYGADGALQRSVDIPVDAYKRDLPQSEICHTKFSDDLSLTAISTADGTTTVFDNATRRKLGSVNTDGVWFEPNSTILNGTCQLPPRTADAFEPPNGWVSYDPRSGQPPQYMPIEERETPDAHSDKDIEREPGYALGAESADTSYTPDAPVTLQHYQNGAVDDSSTFTADPFDGLSYTLTVAASRDGSCLLLARQRTLPSNHCLLLYRDGQPTATPVVYYGTDTELAGVSGNTLLLVTYSEELNPTYVLVHP